MVSESNHKSNKTHRVNHHIQMTEQVQPPHGSRIKNAVMWMHTQNNNQTYMVGKTQRIYTVIVEDHTHSQREFARKMVTKFL